MNSILIAHVADSVERISGGKVEDYDAAADFAAELLSDHAEVREAASAYDADNMTGTEFDAVIARAAALAGE
jgi:hypothetical protein